MALYHRLSMLLQYSCTIVHNKYNINKNIEQYNIKEFNQKYFFIHLNKFHP